MRGGLRLRSVGAGVLVAAMLAGAACGQKPGVVGKDNALRAVPVPGDANFDVAAIDDGGAAFEAARQPLVAGSGIRATVDRGGRPGVTGASTVSSGRPGGRPTSTVTRGPGSTASGGQDPGGPAPSARPVLSPGRDRTGVSATEIVIGVHGPITGAGPIPQDKIDKVKDLYWKWLRERGGIHGRNVRVVFRDDQYNPTRALQVCREMAEEEHAFLLVGFGVDQIAACAHYAAENGVPYFSAGGPEFGLEQLKTYFALSMSYQAQSPMLAQLVMRSGRTNLGIVVENTPNHNDAYESIIATARAAGLQIVRNSRISKTADQGQALAEAAALRQAGAEAVYAAVSPMVFLNLAHASQGQAYNPLWVGPGITNGINVVAEFGCPSIGAAKFLSPFPQLDVIDRYDPDYRAAYRKYNNGEEPDDIGVISWGLHKTLHLMLAAPGRDLSRLRFLAALESGKEFASGVLPPVRYGPGRHFGASQAHLLEADCNRRRYRTLKTFVSAL